MLGRVLGLFAVVVIGATALGGCDIFDMRACEDIDAIDQTKLEQVWPEFVPIDYAGGGACDGSGDPRALHSPADLSDDAVDQIIGFLGDEGWTYVEENSDPTYQVWTRSVDGETYEADIWHDTEGQGLDLYHG